MNIIRLALLTIIMLIHTAVAAEIYYVATNGNDGRTTTQARNINTPWATWQKAINEAYPGDTIFIRGGVYYLSGLDPWVEVNPQRWPTGTGRTGTKANPIFIGAYPPDYEAGNHPILDCHNAYEEYGTNFSCFGLNAVEYWHIKGLTVRNAYQRGNANRRPQGFGATNSRNLIFENCTAYNISARGFYYESGAWNTWDAEYSNPSNPPYSIWPYDGAHNTDTTYFINCDAYDIRDSINCSSGDGWKCGNYFGGVMIFEDCRAWEYSDDGFDPSGAGKRIFKNCWAMATNKYASLCGGATETNGFKTSAVGLDQSGHYPSDYHFVEYYNCIATRSTIGFYNNLELGTDNGAIYYNNTSYNNVSGFFDVPIPALSSRRLIMRNNIAYKNSSPDYSQAGVYNPSRYTESHNTWIATQQSGGWPGWNINPAYTVTDADFVSLDDSQLILPRKSDGSLPDITFLTLAAGSDLIDTGIDVGLPYYGSAPDLGYAEYNPGQQSSAKNIISFSLPQATGPATINTGNHTVSIEVAYGTNVTSLTPTITVSALATITPTSGTAQNFTSPVNYTVTAEDSSIQVWTVTVTVAEGPEPPEPEEPSGIIIHEGIIIRHNNRIVKIEA
jgi:hypothetical protein